MEQNKKTKFTVYLDEGLLKKTDAFVPVSGCGSRNRFLVKAIEHYIAELTLQDTDTVLAERMSSLVSSANEPLLKDITAGLFRYAVFVDMMTQMMADTMQIPKGKLDEYRREAYNNVRRTRGLIPLEKTLKHTETDGDE